VAPFANRWFPNPYFHPGMEQMYLSDLRHYEGIRHAWQIPWQLAVRGRETGGLLGPVFLLAPLALLAFASGPGRQLLLAAAVFAVPAYFNAGTRFLIPALPFLGLALGTVLSQFPAVMIAVALIHCLAGWPNVLSRYCDPTAWRIRSIPVAAALRRMPEPKFLEEHVRNYSWKPALETLVPPRGKVLSLDGLPQAYFSRTIVVGYESALGNFALDVIAAAIDRRAQARERKTFRFLPVTAQGVRVVETASALGFWSISELRVASRGKELVRSPDWRVDAWPNGWDAPLAFDNSYASRWSSWQAMEPGMFLALKFAKPQVLDELIIEGAVGAEAKVQVEVLRSEQWVPLSDTAQVTPLDVPSGLRRAAAQQLKVHGIRYLLVSDSDFYADDMRKYPTFWGLTELREQDRSRLYIIN
jgi:hypothetical protein